MDDTTAIKHTTGTDLIPALPAVSSALIVFTEPGAIDAYLEHVRKAVAEFKPDISSKKGREAVASMAFKVSQSKTALEKIGKELADVQKEIPKKIDATRKRIKDELDALRDKVRAPLDKWEADEKERRSAHEFRLQMLGDMAIVSSDLELDELRDRLNKVEQIIAGGNFEEYSDTYSAFGRDAMNAIGAAIEARQKRDAEAAELARLREESAQREAKERAEREAREAAEQAERAEQERKERDERIAREAAERAQREADEARKREAEKAAARLKAEQNAREQAEREAKEAVERAEREKVEAERRAKEQAEAAAAAERKRIADEQAKEKADAEAREANKKHVQKIMGAARDAMIALGVSKTDCDKITLAIAQKKIPNVTMSF